MNRIKTIIIVFLFFSNGNLLHSQMEINENTTKKVNKKTDTSTWNVEIFALANWSRTIRLLESNEGIFGEELGEREFERSLDTWSYGMGFRSRINDFLAWEGGISYLTNGESYRYEESDSIFEYTHTYSYISMPVKINFIYGKNLGFIGGAGLIPQMFLSNRRHESWRSADNTTGSNKETFKNGYNSFVLSAVVNAGFFARYNHKWVIGIIPEYRFQFTSSYQKIDPYRHFGRALGVNISVGLQL